MAYRPKNLKMWPASSGPGGFCTYYTSEDSFQGGRQLLASSEYFHDEETKFQLRDFILREQAPEAAPAARRGIVCFITSIDGVGACKLYWDGSEVKSINVARWNT